jgi:phytoene dehydrogenase-like protein
VLARAGLRVLVREGADVPGGSARSEALTLPGYTHDVCSAVHPLGIGSPFFRRLPLAAQGLEWIQPPAAVAPESSRIHLFCIDATGWWLRG